MDGGGKNFLSLLTTSETLPHPPQSRFEVIFLIKFIFMYSIMVQR